MAAPILNTLWNWLRVRASEWTATGVLPPPQEKLRWPHQAKLYLLLLIGLSLGLFLLSFVQFFGLWFTWLRFSAPPLSPSSFFEAIARCWRFNGRIDTNLSVYLALLPLQVIRYFWNRRAVRLAQQTAAVAAANDTIWPPPPQRPI